MVVRSLVDVLENVDYRLRGEEESAYYRDYTWTNSRAAAAKALQAKRNERDLLLYRGEPSWRYRKNLKTVDEAIVKLEEALAEIDTLAPVVEGKPVFTLSDRNRSGTFPPPPKEGEEYRFCIDQKADAFLVGSLSEYHGRIYLDIKVYTLHTRSYSYEDNVLFSPEDITGGAMDEITSRLAAAVSGTLPSGILVHATPPDAMVLIDGSFAGRGTTEIHTHSPGQAEIAVRADNYFPVSVPLELNAGELAELYIDLTPLGLAAFEATVPGSPASRVYLGCLYVGETPLTLQLPRTQFAYISVETPEGRIGSMIYRDNNIVRGSANFVRFDDTPDGGGTAAFSTKVPVSPEEKRVDAARQSFYRTYGAFWIILPTALITGGIARSYIDAHNNHVASPDYDPNSSKAKKIYDRAMIGSTVYYTAQGVWVAALGVTIFQIVRYLYVSGADSTPLAPGAGARTQP